MLPILLALFLNFDAGQMQSDYKDILTRVITHGANAQEFPQEASVRTLESPNVITITIPPKIRYSDETIQLKPIITDVSLPTIIHETRTIPIELQKTVHAEPSTKVFDIAAPPPKTHETIQLKPIITDVSLPTIIHETRTIPIELQKTVHAEPSTKVFDIAAPPSKTHEIIQLKPIITDVSLPTIIHETRTIPIEVQKTVHAEPSTNVFDIAAPPPKIQFNIQHETMELKPKISGVFSQTINEITQEADQNIGPKVSVNEIKDEGPVNVIRVTAPPPKIQLIIKNETIRLQPKVPDVITHTINEITQEADQNNGPRVSVNEIKNEGSVNVIEVATPPPKIVLNIKHETIRLQPKIPDVITHTINGITEGAIQGNAPGANFQVIDETSPYNVKPTKVVHIVEPPPEVQFNITHETIEPKPKITNVTSLTINEITKEVKETTPEADAHEEEPEADLPTGGSAVVTSTTTLEPMTYGPEIENSIETQPQTFEEPVNDASDNNQVPEQPGKLESKTEPDVNEVNQPINVDYQIKTMKPDVKDHKTIITDIRERISGQQKVGKPPHKPAHKKGTKKPAHVHKKHKKIVKKTIYRVNQHINVDYHVRSTSNVKIGHGIKKIGKPPHKSAHKNGTKKPAHVHKKHKKIVKKTIYRVNQHINVDYHIRSTSNVKIGRRIKKIHRGMRVPGHGRNILNLSEKAHKKCTKRPTHVHKPKKPMRKPHKVYNIRIEDRTKIRVHGQIPFPRPIKTMKPNRDKHPHLSRPKIVKSSQMKHPSSPKHKLTQCMCKICRAKLARMNKHVSLKPKTDHSGRIRISGLKIDRTVKRPAPKIAHEKRIKKPMPLNDVLAVNRKLRHNIRILKKEKTHLHFELKKHTSRPVNVIHRAPKPVKVHSKPKIIRHPHIAHKRVLSEVRRPPTNKRVIKGCGCKLRVKRDISSHKARYNGGESGIFHENPAENVNVELRPKRDFVGRLEMPAHVKFVYGKMRYPLSRSHKSRRNQSSGEIKPSDSSHDGKSIGAAGSLQFDNWLKFGTCEYMVKRNAKTYDNAEIACQKHDAHLVSIHSESENNFIHKVTSTGSRVESFEDFVWIGLRMNSQNQWEWVDGSSLDYQKWAVNQQNHSDEEKCAQLYQGPANLIHVQEYHWNSFRCNRPMKYYVCKRCKGSARGREHTRIDLRTVKA